MEISSMRSLAELGMVDPGLFHQLWPANPFNELNNISMASEFSDGFNQPFSQSVLDFRKATDLYNLPTKQMDTYLDSCDKLGMSEKPKEEEWSSYGTLNFPSDAGVYVNQNDASRPCRGVKRSSPDSRLNQAQDHIMAERKRREKLSQRFIALSRLVPGLQKTDKASVLGDAIKHMKQLQERVKTLEEQTRKKSIESVVFVKKYEICADSDDASPSDEDLSGDPFNVPLPEIEARFSDRHVLVRVHCEKRKGVLEKTVDEIEKLHVSVVNSSAMSFGNSALDITIVAKMDEEFDMQVKDFVKHLRAALQIFM